MTAFSLDRRRFLELTAAGVAASLGPGAVKATAKAAPVSQDEVAWHDVRQWGVEGKGWADTARYFDRFPARAEQTVRPEVWNLSRHSAGMLTRFETNSSEIHARYALLSDRLQMFHMPATGVSGLDLYARDAQGGDRWLAVSRPESQEMTLKLASEIDPLPGGKPRLYTLYLPLYNGVESLEIGVDPQAEFRPTPPRTEKPIVFYGTSIMHGACASRPGISMTAIIGRRLNRPTINLGFSGNGRMEAAVGALLAELDVGVYVIDCLPNMLAEHVAERAAPLVRQLRSARPDAPILLVEDRTYAYARFRQSVRDRHAASRAALRRAYQNLTAAGVRNLFYLEGEPLLGDDGEATTDGSHPNDLGMVRYADAYEGILRQILSQA
jgi:lysophospholipase L1-like esterase